MEQKQVLWKQTNDLYRDLNELELSDSDKVLHDDRDISTEKWNAPFIGQSQPSL